MFGSLDRFLYCVQYRRIIDINPFLLIYRNKKHFVDSDKVLFFERKLCFLSEGWKSGFDK
jgi:hypothetical protein